MHDQDITIDVHPTQDDVDFIEHQLAAFNGAATALPFGVISCVIRDTENAIIAGVHGYTWGDCGHIDAMWVHEALRGQGYGRKLLHIIEAEAIKRGCRLMVTETFSFQALPFYQKAEYEVVGKVDGFPTHPHQNFFLKKTLQEL